MINALIIDDEPDALESLQMAIDRYCPEVFVLGACEEPEIGLEAILKRKPDLIFLDVQMPRMSGFDVLKQVSPLESEIIFISGYDQYALKAIKFSALDYLLKPVDAGELVQAVHKVQDRLQSKINPFPYQSVLNNLQFNKGKVERLAVPSSEGIDFFYTDDIIYCQAEGNYTKLFLTESRTFLISRKLKEFECQLSHSNFCRVHHSSLINMKHIYKYIRGEGGYVVLSEGHHVDISRRKKEEFMGLLNRL